MQVRRIGRYCLLAVTLLAPATVIFGQGNSENVRAMNGSALQLKAALERSNPAEAPGIRAQAEQVLTQRASALTSLMKSDPSAALGLAFSQELLNAFAEDFPRAESFLEQHGTWEGTSDHLIFDDPGRQVRRYQVQIQTGAGTLEVYSAAGEPHCISGDRLSVAGVRIGNVVAAAGTSAKGDAGVAAAGCTTTGQQNLAILLVQFPGIPLPSTVTPASVWDIFFAGSGRSVNNYWSEASYGKASATGAVFGPYTLNRSYTCDEYYAMRSAAIAAADADVNFRSYSRVFIVFPDPGGCGWAGLGTLGCSTLSSADGNFTASSSWLLATYMNNRDNGVRLAAHEGGHNLTLHHASSRDFGTEALGPVNSAGTLSEYGDTHSTMGSWNFGHYAAPHKARMGWLTGSNVLTTESNGSHTILPFETLTGGVQALKVRRGTGNNAWLWLEYRQSLGLYDSTLNSQVFSGGLIHYEDSSTGTYSHLLDFTTDTSSFADAALTGTFTDPYTNVSVEVTNASASGLSVNVAYGPVPCVRAQPTVSLSPPNPSVYSGAAVNYTVTVTNNDSTGCAASTMTLSSSNLEGWSTSFSAPTLTLNPAQSGTVTMTKNVPAAFTPGTWPVSATATDSEHTATGNANCTVMTPPTPIYVSQLSVTPATVAVRANVTIQAVITKGSGVPAAGAAVTFTMSRPGGTTTQTVTTNASGVVTWSYKPTKKGSYSVTASASLSGSTATGGPVTFTVN
jgi:M6 family metalloprotease-like protein